MSLPTLPLLKPLPQWNQDIHVRIGPRLELVSESPGEPLKMQTAGPHSEVTTSQSGFRSRIGISNEFLSDADATGPRTTLCLRV